MYVHLYVLPHRKLSDFPYLDFPALVLTSIFRPSIHEYPLSAINYDDTHFVTRFARRT